MHFLVNQGNLESKNTFKKNNFWESNNLSLNKGENKKKNRTPRIKRSRVCKIRSEHKVNVREYLGGIR